MTTNNAVREAAQGWEEASRTLANLAKHFPTPPSNAALAKAIANRLRDKYEIRLQPTGFRILPTELTTEILAVLNEGKA